MGGQRHTTPLDNSEPGGESARPRGERGKSEKQKQSEKRKQIKLMTSQNPGPWPKLRNEATLRGDVEVAVAMVKRAERRC